MVTSVKDYLDGAEADLLQRGKTLLSKIPARQPREFHLLTLACKNELTRLLDELQSLKILPVAERLRKFQRIVADIETLEINGFAALNRATEDDRFLNILIEHITQEINYPLLPPVVTSLSHSYFYIFHKLNLLCVPLGETSALLHLPDLYHELAHPIADERYEPAAQPFRAGLKKSLSIIGKHIAAEQEREQRSRGPQSFKLYLDTWWRSWNQSWLVEFFCDLFATYTLGPAFAWANLHLCAKRGGNVFDVPRHVATSHPSDSARMQIILEALRRTGFVTEARQIAIRWKQFLDVAEYEPTAEYGRCYNTDLLNQLVEISYQSIEQMGCRIVNPSTSDPVYTLLNTAWNQFWNSPNSYPQWEASAVQQLRQTLKT